MITGRLKARRPLLHEFERLDILEASVSLVREVLTHDGNTLFVVGKSALGLCLLEEGCDLEIGVVVVGVQLADMAE